MTDSAARADFIIIGAQKSGTTSLAYQLAQHPQICFAAVKEPHFFSRQAGDAAALAAYQALFAPAPGQICGEASTSYTFFPEFPWTALSIKRHNPDVKLIYIMRQPVERIQSQYSFRRRRGKTNYPADRETIEDGAYIGRSRYGIQLEPYLGAFPREAISLLIFEEYIADPVSTLQSLAGFLNIAAFDPARLDLSPRNQTASRRPHWWRERLRPALLRGVPKSVRRRFGLALPGSDELSPEARQALWATLEPDVRIVEALLGRRLDGWRAAAVGGAALS